jgi:hypothetical protein
MKTEVIMKRELFGRQISQQSKSEFFSATDLVKAGNRWRDDNGIDEFKLSTWLKSKGVKEFISALEEKYGQVKINSKGKGQHTWIHPYLFIDLALAINPKLKIEVYKWLHDHLLKYRNDSGDTYRIMSGALYLNASNKFAFPKYISNVANRVKLECGVKDWQTATEKQLELRDDIHKNIALLSEVLKDNDQAVRLGIDKTKRGKQ